MYSKTWDSFCIGSRPVEICRHVNRVTLAVGHITRPRVAAHASQRDWHVAQSFTAWTFAPTVAIRARLVWRDSKDVTHLLVGKAPLCIPREAVLHETRRTPQRHKRTAAFGIVLRVRLCAALSTHPPVDLKPMHYLFNHTIVRCVCQAALDN